MPQNHLTHPFPVGKGKVINSVVLINTVSPTKLHITVSFPQRSRHLYKSDVTTKCWEHRESNKKKCIGRKYDAPKLNSERLNPSTSIVAESDVHDKHSSTRSDFACLHPWRNVKSKLIELLGHKNTPRKWITLFTSEKGREKLRICHQSTNEKKWKLSKYLVQTSNKHFFIL